MIIFKQKKKNLIIQMQNCFYWGQRESTAKTKLLKEV